MEVHSENTSYFIFTIFENWIKRFSSTTLSLSLSFTKIKENNHPYIYIYIFHPSTTIKRQEIPPADQKVLPKRLSDAPTSVRYDW